MKKQKFVPSALCLVPCAWCLAAGAARAEGTRSAPWTVGKDGADVKVDVSEDGTELVIPVPANAEQGFMVLEPGEATK